MKSQAAVKAASTSVASGRQSLAGPEPAMRDLKTSFVPKAWDLSQTLTEQKPTAFIASEGESVF
jgi:hypothetical protein